MVYLDINYRHGALCLAVERSESTRLAALMINETAHSIYVCVLGILINRNASRWINGAYVLRNKWPQLCTVIGCNVFKTLGSSGNGTQLKPLARRRTIAQIVHSLSSPTDRTRQSPAAHNRNAPLTWCNLLRNHCARAQQTPPHLSDVMMRIYASFVSAGCGAFALASI